MCQIAHADPKPKPKISDESKSQTAMAKNIVATTASQMAKGFEFDTSNENETANPEEKAAAKA